MSLLLRKFYGFLTLLNNKVRGCTRQAGVGLSALISWTFAEISAVYNLLDLWDFRRFCARLCQALRHQTRITYSLECFNDDFDKISCAVCKMLVTVLVVFFWGITWECDDLHRICFGYKGVIYLMSCVQGFQQNFWDDSLSLWGINGIVFVNPEIIQTFFDRLSRWLLFLANP